MKDIGDYSYFEEAVLDAMEDVGIPEFMAETYIQLLINYLGGERTRMFGGSTSTSFMSNWLDEKNQELLTDINRIRDSMGLTDKGKKILQDPHYSRGVPLYTIYVSVEGNQIVNPYLTLPAQNPILEVRRKHYVELFTRQLTDKRKLSES